MTWPGWPCGPHRASARSSCSRRPPGDEMPSRSCARSAEEAPPPSRLTGPACEPQKKKVDCGIGRTAGGRPGRESAFFAGLRSGSRPSAALESCATEAPDARWPRGDFTASRFAGARRLRLAAALLADPRADCRLPAGFFATRLFAELLLFLLAAISLVLPRRCVTPNQSGDYARQEDPVNCVGRLPACLQE